MMEYSLRYLDKEIGEMTLEELEREIRCQTALIEPIDKKAKYLRYMQGRKEEQRQEQLDRGDKIGAGRTRQRIERAEEQIAFMESFLWTVKGYREAMRDRRNQLINTDEAERKSKKRAAQKRKAKSR